MKIKSNKTVKKVFSNYSGPIQDFSFRISNCKISLKGGKANKQ